MANLDLLIGLVAIALAVFFGLWSFRKGIISELTTIKETVIAIRTTAEKTWDLVLRRFAESGGTVERQLDKLGRVKITAEPAANETSYTIEIEKPILKEGLLLKKFQEPRFVKVEKELLGKEGMFYVLSPMRFRYELPSTDPKVCTQFITFVLKELNETYFELLGGVKDFEESILT